MAKGNLFQSMGRGALGDLVFQRVNGEQQTRVRVRHPRNTRTDGQQYQRAIMATILRAYEAGQAIFSHSFQGNGTTANDQPLFMQQNLELLRKAIANDIDRHLAPNVQAGRVVAPDTNNPVPFAYQISDGTYQQTLFSFGNGSTDYDVTIPRPQANESVSHYCKRVGIIPGDYYTDCSETAPSVKEPLYLDLILDASCVWNAEDEAGSANYKITNSWDNVICDLYHDDVWPVSQYTEVEVGTALYQ